MRNTMEVVLTLNAVKKLDASRAEQFNMVYLKKMSIIRDKVSSGDFLPYMLRYDISYSQGPAFVGVSSIEIWLRLYYKPEMLNHEFLNTLALDFELRRKLYQLLLSQFENSQEVEDAIGPYHIIRNESLAI